MPTFHYKEKPKAQVETRASSSQAIYRHLFCRKFVPEEGSRLGGWCLIPRRPLHGAFEHRQCMLNERSNLGTQDTARGRPAAVGTEHCCALPQSVPGGPPGGLKHPRRGQLMRCSEMNTVSLTRHPPNTTFLIYTS